MHIIVCLDDKNGMLFNRRRQSSDRALRRHLMSFVGARKLWMNGYSAKQFSEPLESISIAEDFLEKAGWGEFCFVENLDIFPYLARVEEVIVYRWNSVYPADLRMPDAVLASRKLVHVESFPGNSHKELTQEVYAR